MKPNQNKEEKKPHTQQPKHPNADEKSSSWSNQKKDNSGGCGCK